jgi:excinuclease ABC subunit C
VERSEERFFLPGRKNPVSFRHGSASLFLLERLRDEAHRFAITYHRKLRSKVSLHSSLEDIPGVGPARRKALLKHFGSLKRIRAATLDDLQQMPGISDELAETIFRALSKL